MTGKREKIIFTTALCALSAFSVYESIHLWNGHKGVDGPAFVPLTVSVLLLILSFFELVSELRTVHQCQGDKDTDGETQKDTCRFSIISISGCCIMIVLYCVLICAEVSFWIVSPVFLFALMTFLSKGHIFRNLLITCAVIGFIYMLFVICFGVYLP